MAEIILCWRSKLNHPLAVLISSMNLAKIALASPQGMKRTAGGNAPGTETQKSIPTLKGSHGKRYGNTSSKLRMTRWLIGPVGGFSGRAERAVFIPTDRAALSSVGESDRKRISPGGTPRVAAIFR